MTHKIKIILKCVLIVLLTCIEPIDQALQQKFVRKNSLLCKACAQQTHCIRYHHIITAYKTVRI